GQDTQPISGAHGPHERDGQDAGVRRGWGTGRPAENPRDSLGPDSRYIRQGRRSGAALRARRGRKGGCRSLPLRRRSDHRRGTQGRTGRRELLRQRTLLRALQKEHKPAGRYKRQQDKRRLRERVAGGHRDGRGRSSRARAHTDREPVQL
ncbi:MAG: hypothetical protein AVDCRST_MAG58-2108, partial [uncultured Rubrobacteraceae bacterium]